MENEILDPNKEHIHEWQLFRVKVPKGKVAKVVAVCKICLDRKEVPLVPNEQID
jgi:hypothetical protein